MKRGGGLHCFAARCNATCAILMDMTKHNLPPPPCHRHALVRVCPDNRHPHDSRPGSSDASNGYVVVARALARLGVRYMYGVIGIPVTELASAAQARKPEQPL